MMTHLQWVSASCLVLLITFTGTQAQTTIPTPYSNGNTWNIGNDATFVATGASTGRLTISGIGLTLTFQGNGASTTGVGTEYWGRLTFITLAYGVCMRLTHVGSTTVAGFTFRTNLTAITIGSNTINANVVNSAVTSMTQAIACTAGGLRPEFERAAVDLTSGSYTPNSCPSVLQYAFTNYSAMAVGGAWTCGTTADTANGVTTTGHLTFTTSSCPAAATFFNLGSTMYCLNQFTRGSSNFVLLANATSSPIHYYCASYNSPSAGQVDMTIVKEACDPTQTSSSVGGAASGMGLSVKLTYIPTTTGTGGAGGGAGHVVSSLLLIASCLFVSLRR